MPEPRSRNNVTKKSDAIKPFFISHPCKVLDQNGIEMSKSEFNPTQVFSMSSDSGLFLSFSRAHLIDNPISYFLGMEEYDCHSSTENSPLGYQVINNSSKSSNKRQDLNEPRPKAKLPSRSTTVSRPKPGKPSAHSPRCRIDQCGQSQMKAPYGKPPAGHWSETNLQSELGYMP